MGHAPCMFWHHTPYFLCVYVVLALATGVWAEFESNKTTLPLDNYQWIMQNIWRWPTYPPDWPSHLPTTTFVVPVYSNPSTPLRFLKIVKDNDEACDALEAKLETYRQLCEVNKTEIKFVNRSQCFSDADWAEYYSIIGDIRHKIKFEKAKFRNGTYLLRDINELKKRVRSSLVKIALAMKKHADMIPEFTFQTRRTEYFFLVDLEKETKKIRKMHKLRFQLLQKYHKYYMRHYKPTTTKGPIRYENLPPGLQELVDAGQYNITGAIFKNYITRKVKHTTNLEAIFRNITTKKWKRLTGPELEEAMKKWNRYTPDIYFRKFKTTTPWSVTVAVKRELNRRKYERMMNNLQKRIQAGITTRVMKRWMRMKHKNTRVPKRYTQKTRKIDKHKRTEAQLDDVDFVM